MILRTTLVLSLLLGITAIGFALNEQSPADSNSASALREAKEKMKADRPTLIQARRQAQLLHEAMHSTLQHVHHELYEEDRGLPLPAAVLKDVFAELEKKQQVKLRWLAVEGRAMNVDHTAATAFEKEAVQVLSAGKSELEQIEKGIYHHAGAITLTNACLKCHVPDRKSTEDRTAGLIISIPIID